jgi:hypothetical protein
MKDARLGRAFSMVPRSLRGRTGEKGRPLPSDFPNLDLEEVSSPFPDKEALPQKRLHVSFCMINH